MGTSIQQISDWFDRGVRNGATHMLVVCDTFDHEDYPIYVFPGEYAHEKATLGYGYPGEKNMQRVMECYDLNRDKEEQLAVGRVFNFGTVAPVVKPAKPATFKEICAKL